MNANKENFLKWFKQPLEQLYSNSDAGFAVMVISLPLLERYLREKSKTFEATSVSLQFHRDLIKLFPVLSSEEFAKKFWESCRHGLLHQVTFRQKTASDPAIDLTGGIKEFEYDAKQNAIRLNPFWFSKKIVETIESDFSTFEGLNSSRHKLPQISQGIGLRVSDEPGKPVGEQVCLLSGTLQFFPPKSGSV